MSEFTRGALFAVGMFMFGKGMYGLGQIKEQEKTLKFLEEVSDELEKSIEDVNQKLKEAGAL